MRKIIPLIIISLIFGSVLFFGLKSKKTLDIIYVNKLNQNEPRQINICVLNEKNNLVFVKTNKHNEEDIYIYVLKIYDNYRNNIPTNYKTPLKGNFEIIDFTKKNNVINIGLKLSYFEAGLQDFLTALSWSYKDLGITKINLKINGELFYLEENRDINLINDAIDIYSSEKQIIYYQNAGEIIPVTYYHNDDKASFLMKKLALKYSGINYNISFNLDFLIINIYDYNDLLTEKIINLMILSLEETKEYQNIIIIKNNNIIYNN